MLINKLRIDSQMFYLAPDQDVDALKQQILSAAHGVTQFVVFTPVGRGQVSVLVTPYTPVRFEEHEHSEEEFPRWEDDSPQNDFMFDS